MTKENSNRKKKKFLQKGVEALRAKPGWDPSQKRALSPEEKLTQLGQEKRNQEAYQKTQDCVECKNTQEETHDTSALCQKHFAEVMGF